MKAALFLFAGPEMPCKLQHAVLFARDIKQRGGQALIILEGNAPKWLLELPSPEHKLHKLYLLAKAEQLFAGVCKVCAGIHGADDAASAEGLSLLDDAFGHASIVPFSDDGYQIITL